MSDVRPCRAKTHLELAAEWDRLAEERHRQIVSGDDLSFEHVLVPTVLRLLRAADTTSILDVGSGTGELTKRLGQCASNVIGIEPSGVSVSVATEACSQVGNIQFIQASLEEFESRFHEQPATAAVAAMTLMTTPDLVGFADSLSRSLQDNASFVATVTHPCFWPRYWGYEREPWFCYTEEIFIEAPFVISRCPTTLTTTHIHRPLQTYMSVFESVGFRLREIEEPIPPLDVQTLYPRPWSSPRFLGLRWTLRKQ